MQLMMNQCDAACEELQRLRLDTQGYNKIAETHGYTGRWLREKHYRHIAGFVVLAKAREALTTCHQWC